MSKFPIAKSGKAPGMKGKDTNPANEASERKKGMSPTEVKRMLGKMHGTEGSEPLSKSKFPFG